MRARRHITEREPNKVHNSLHTADRGQDIGKDNRGCCNAKGAAWMIGKTQRRQAGLKGKSKRHIQKRHITRQAARLRSKCATTGHTKGMPNNAAEKEVARSLSVDKQSKRAPQLVSSTKG